MSEEAKLNSLDSLKAWAEESNPGIRDEVMYCAKYWVWNARTHDWDFTDCCFHAKDIGDARLKFWQSEGQRKFRRIRVVAIAPVIGYLVHDNHGDKLSV